jgi:non-ribosomal peptide synthetase component F
MMNIVNGNLWAIQPGDRVAMTANPTFDVSAHDIWGTLCHGATLFALTAHLADIRAVTTFFRKNTINKTFLPTAVFHRIASNSGSTTSLGMTLRMILVGGEKLSTASVASFLRFAPSTRLVNIYGPTETTVCSTTFEIPPDIFEGDSSRPIPIGRCIPNTTLFILDDKLRPVDSGFPGEICIGGAGLAAGYLGQDQATSSKFGTSDFDRGCRVISLIFCSGDQ